MTTPPPMMSTAAAMLSGLAVPAIATTDDQTDEPTTDAPSADDDAPDADARGDRHRHPVAHAALHGLEEGELAERLAAELDLDTATVQDAIEAVRADLAAERLADAVESGRLTQEQADRITAAAAAGTLDEVLPEIRLEELAERLDERVEEGDLTREQADEILADAEAGDWPGRGRGHHGPRGRGGPGPDGAGAADDGSL